MPIAAEGEDDREAPDRAWLAGLGTVLREWGRIGVTGFGGPPAHIALLRRLCVEREGWLDAAEFEDAIAACNLLPGPASTELAIFCAWRVRGRLGAVVGGLAFIVPGLIVILVLSALFLAGTPPLWVRGAGAGAGAAVAAVAVQAGWTLLTPSWKRASAREPVRVSRLRWAAYLLAGGAASATIGAWLVLVLLGCGTLELTLRRVSWRRPTIVPALAPLFPATLSGGVLAAVAWVAFKVGALSFGGGFVIIPLMHADAVGRGWMTNAQFLNAVALGQITPGPVVQTVSAVGYAAAGLPGGLLAAVVAFSPSFAFVLGGGRYFSRLRESRAAQAFLDGAGPAAIGAIFGAAVLLARALSEGWQFAVLAGAAAALLALRRGVVLTLLSAAGVGLIVAFAGGPLPALGPSACCAAVEEPADWGRETSDDPERGQGECPVAVVDGRVQLHGQDDGPAEDEEPAERHDRRAEGPVELAGAIQAIRQVELADGVHHGDGQRDEQRARQQRAGIPGGPRQEHRDAQPGEGVDDQGRDNEAVAGPRPAASRTRLTRIAITPMVATRPATAPTARSGARRPTGNPHAVALAAYSTLLSDRPATRTPNRPSSTANHRVSPGW